MVKGIGVAVFPLRGKALVVFRLLLGGDAGVDNNSVTVFLPLWAALLLGEGFEATQVAHNLMQFLMIV
ncbi:hypothetical protein [Pontibacter brevis]